MNEILDISKIEAGKLELKPTRFNLKELLENSLSIIADKAAQRRIRLTANIEGLPATITADELRMKQILYNLLANAVKFTGEGGSISLSALIKEGITGIPAKSAPDGRELEISITDTGIGIHRDDFEKIFKPFSQLESSLNRKYPGTGLGLELTRRLVELHGGRVWVESDGPGTGSTFRFTLPYAPGVRPPHSLPLTPRAAHS